MSKDISIQTYKVGALVTYRLIGTLVKLQLADKEARFLARDREDNIIRAWRYSKKNGK